MKHNLLKLTSGGLTTVLLKKGRHFVCLILVLEQGSRLLKFPLYILQKILLKLISKIGFEAACNKMDFINPG